jgi:CHC2 zinc finger
MKIEDIKARLDIVTLAERYTQLDKLGGNTYRAKTNPIREDNTPSFTIYADTQKWYDFGSSESGDVLDLLERVEGLTRSEAMDRALSLIGESPLFPKFPKTTQVARSFQDETPKLNLNDIADKQKAVILKLFESKARASLQEQVNKLISPNLYINLSCSHNALSSLGVSTKDKSLTVILKDGDEVKAIRTRYFKDANGNLQKWKCQGELKFIPSKLTGQEIVYCAFGTAETLIFECLNLDYFILQSDSVAKDLHANSYFMPIMEKLTNKVIAVLLDNDESCRKAYETMKANLANLFLIGIDFEAMQAKELPKGYDFRDFANEIANSAKNHDEAKSVIIDTLKNEILNLLKEGDR